MRKLLVAASLLLTAGCNSTGAGNPSIGQAEQLLVEDGNDAMAAGDTASSLVSIASLALRGQGEIVDTESAAVIVEERTSLFFEPAGCLTSTREGAEVTFAFDGCRTGAFGLLEVQGTMIASYELSGATLGVSLASEPGLSIGRTEITLSSESFVTIGLVSTTVVWNGRYQAARPLLPDVDHEASYSSVFDSNTQCLRLDGSATTSFDGGRGVETSLTNHLRCGPAGTCPTSGELSLVSLPGREHEITLEFSGGATAWEPNRETEVELACSP